MNKNNKKKTSTALAVKAPPKASIPRSIMKSNVEQVCGLSDPFCKHAIGAKFPDDSSSRTLAFSHRGLTTITTDPGGYAAVMWNPTYSNYPIAYPTDTLGPSGNLTTWDSLIPNDLFTQVDSYRIVSSGFVLRSISAPLDASGLVSVRSYGTAASELVTVPALSFGNGEALDVPLRLVNELAVVTPHSSQVPQEFYSTGSDGTEVSSWQQVGYDPITIYVSGAPKSVTILSLEYVINYELIFSPVTGMSLLATPPPTAKQYIISAAARVTSTLKPFAEKGVKVIAESVVKAAGTAIGAYFGGPSGALVGYKGTAMIVD